MTEARLKLGQWGEEQAAGYLERKGFRILMRNYRCRAGEIDIIAANKKYLIFVEVKTRRSTFFGAPQEAVNQRKQQQIIRASQWYLLQQKIARLQPRFDVIAVLWQSWDLNPDITHFENAFSVND